MNKTIKYLTAVAIIVTLSIVPVSAETIKKDPICKTTTECDKLTERLQTEIDGLEAKDSLTKNEKKLRYTLRKQLLAAQKAKTARLDKQIIEEKAKTTEAKAKTAEMLKEQNKMLDEVKTLLK